MAATFKGYSANPYTLSFSTTHMKVTYTEGGVAKSELFELHRTKPEGVFETAKTMTVTASNGQMFAYGIIPGAGRRSPIRYVSWPV